MLLLFVLVACSGCIWASPSQDCADFHLVKSGDTCASIQKEHRVHAHRLMKLNPGLDCNNLTVNVPICVNTDHFGCLNYTEITSSVSCSDLVSQFSIALHTLTAVNPGIDCSSPLTAGAHVCVEAINPKCRNKYTVNDTDSIQSIISKYDLDPTLFFAANPFLDPTASLQVGELVCLRPLHSHLHIVTTDPNVVNLRNIIHSIGGNGHKFDKFIKNPLSKHAQDYQASILDLIANNSDAKAAFKAYEDSYGAAAVAASGVNKLCDQLSATQFPLAKQCVCDNIEPTAACMLIFEQESKSANWHSSNGTLTGSLDIKKRQEVTCDAGYSINTEGQICYGGGCCLDDILCVDANECFPLNGDIFDFNYVLSIELCVPGLHDILEHIGLGAFVCIDLLKFEYYPYRGTVGIPNFYFPFPLMPLIVVTGDVQFQMYSHSSGSEACDGSPNCGVWIAQENFYCFTPPGHLTLNDFSLKGQINTVIFGVYSVNLYSFGNTIYQCGSQNYLPAGLSLNPGNQFKSYNGQYNAIMQSDCNFVLYNANGQALWNTGTYMAQPTTDCYFDIQTDGNVVVYQHRSRGSPVWASQTSGMAANGNNYVVLQDDGNLVLYSGTTNNCPLWASQTGGGANNNNNHVGFKTGYNC
jgi:LysM repeat protein